MTQNEDDRPSCRHSMTIQKDSASVKPGRLPESSEAAASLMASKVVLRYTSKSKRSYSPLLPLDFRSRPRWVRRSSELRMQ